MEELPNEIIEKITENLDGVSLVQLKRTCRRFAAVVNLLECERNMWCQQCLLDISDDVFLELTNSDFWSSKTYMQSHWKTLTKEKISVSSAFAETYYKKWYSQRLMNADHENVSIQFDMFDSKSVPHRYHGCTCMKLSGRLMITGHGNGKVYTWDIDSGKCLGDIVTHKRTIVEIHLIDFFNDDLLRGDVGLFEIDHHHVLTVSMDNRMKVVRIYGDGSSDSDEEFTYRPEIRVELKQARIFKNKVALMWSNGQVQLLKMKMLGVYPMEFRPKKLKLVPIGTITLLPEPSSWMSFWNDKVIVVQPNLDRYSVPIKGDTWSCHPPTFLDDQGAPSNSPIVATACNLFRENIIIMRTVSRHLCISVDGIHYRSFATMKDLGGVVTCVTVKGNLLLLGTDYGGLYLYYFETNADLMNLNLGKPIWTGMLSGGRTISYVDIKLNEREPVLVACDCWSVVAIKWQLSKFKRESSEKLDSDYSPMF